MLVAEAGIFVLPEVVAVPDGGGVFPRTCGVGVFVEELLGETG
jgi:hypothetical protein